MLNSHKMYWSVALLLSVLLKVDTAEAGESISLKEAIEQAQLNDPWLHANRYKQQATLDKSIASGTMADPNITIGLANMPVDSFDFNQEAMTQVKIGVSQVLPRGDSLSIKQTALQIEASKHPLMRANRRAQVASITTQLWLDAYLAQRTIKLILADKSLFEQMVDIANASYSSAAGKTRQQDVIRAQLELIQLDERLAVQYQALEAVLSTLSAWVKPYNGTVAENSASFSNYSALSSVSETLPELQLSPQVLAKSSRYSQDELARIISRHPAIQAIETDYRASIKRVALANEQYEPQWGLNASYGYRDDSPVDSNRSDFFSVGVSFDLPLFTENKQDKIVSASIASAEAVKTEKLLLLRSMAGEVDKDFRNLKGLYKRQSIYANQLLNQLNEQAEVALTAYTNDDGEFSDVVSARIAELNARIASLGIDIEALKTVARLNYYFVSAVLPTKQATLAVGEQ